MPARRPPPPLGPYPVVDGACTIPVWDRFTQQNRWSLVSAEDYRLAMAKLWVLDHTGFVKSADWHPVEQKTTNVSLSRLILKAPKNRQVDHIHHDRLDNRREMLRLATPAQNSANRRKGWLPAEAKSSRFRGVTRAQTKAEKWQVGTAFEGKPVYLGIFDDEESAARAYDRAALQFWGEFATLNFPDESGDASRVVLGQGAPT